MSGTIETEMPLRVSGGKTKPCSLDGCETDSFCRGWCQKHYYRWYRHGDPLWLPPGEESFESRLARNVEVGDCWLWTGAIKGHGYGNIAWQGKWYNAHLWVWRNLVGEVPEGLHLDHLCRIRHCVNPDHLEPVTPKVNSGRGSTASKRWCKRGHDLDDPVVTRIGVNGGRACRPCRAIGEKERRARIKSQK